MRGHSSLLVVLVVFAFVCGFLCNGVLWNADLIARWTGRIQRTYVSLASERSRKLPELPSHTPELVLGEPEVVPQDPEGPSETPQPRYTYNFPFADGRRAEVPTGDLVDNARAVYRNMSEAILERWGRKYEHTLFSQGMMFADEGKVVEDKILNAIVQQGGFVAAFTGTSVTAGHDNFYEQSYPIVLNATMSKLFAAAGVRYEATNVAMGNTRPFPYSFCVDAHVGLDADIISWEMAMMVADNACGPAALAIEAFIRSATVLPRRPAVLILEATPDNSYCPPEKFARIVKHNFNFIGNCSQDQSKQGLMSAYRHFGLHAMFFDQLTPTYTCDDDLFSRDDLFRFGKTYPKPVIWHPGVHGHELVADVLFMHYAHVFLSALERLETASPGITVQQLRDQGEADKATLLVSLGIDNPYEVSGSGSEYMGAGRGDILPATQWCTGWRFCEGAGNYRCSTTYVPSEETEDSTLLGMVSERTPVLNADRQYLEVAPAEGHWAVTLNEDKTSVFDYLREPMIENMHKPIDMKWVLIGNRESGPIEFEFETKGVADNKSNEGSDPGEAIEDSRVVVCNREIIEMADLNDAEAVRFNIDGEETPAEGPLYQKYLNPKSCVVLAAQIGVGRHTLSVEALRSEGPPVGICYIVYPA